MIISYIVFIIYLLEFIEIFIAADLLFLQLIYNIKKYSIVFNRDTSVNSLIAVLVSLGLHISSVALVVNSCEITDYMILKLRYCNATIQNYFD